MYIKTIQIFWGQKPPKIAYSKLLLSKLLFLSSFKQRKITTFFPCKRVKMLPKSARFFR